MKKILVAVGMLAVTATAASAQFGPSPYNRDIHRYDQRHHAVCQDKAMRLHQFERRAAADGRLDRREREIIRGLERDLARTCGGFRHRG
jgi:hypothetical protein